MQGWVQINSDEDEWKHLAVGNERLLKAHGGKIKPSKKMQTTIDEFHSHNKGGVILYVVVEDEIKCLLALSGLFILHTSLKFNSIQCLTTHTIPSLSPSCR